MSVVVLKFGGNTLKDPQMIRAAAQRVALLKKNNHQIIVVVSAMGDTTDRLLKMAYDISSQPCRREMDMLVTAGERVSMALFSMALQEIGLDAISFTGSQAGILTTQSHRGATIKELKPFRVEEALKTGKTVVLAGFQGVSPETKEVTTLGRGGSDITAVAFAAHFKASRCEILKDVNGVYSADPRWIPSSSMMDTVYNSSFSAMTLWGAQVLYHKAAQLSEEKKVPLFIRSAFTQEDGTQITPQEAKEFQWIALSKYENVFLIDKRENFYTETFLQEIEKAQIAPPIILHENDREIWLTTSKESTKPLEELLHKYPLITQQRDLCSLALISNQVIDNQQKQQLIEKLNPEGLTLHCTDFAFVVFCPLKDQEHWKKKLSYLIK